jgi:hypothetical protein
MIIKDMFQKPIDREIKGVIKVGQDDESNIYQELDEYVVTSELLDHFSDFFASYKKGIVGHTDKMGVWISGFFGSGKSHFLKILSYLLANKKVKGKTAVSFFEDKIEDPMVLADMKQVGDISTDVILFNIDAKSDSDSKLHKDSILKVFNKVFNEMQGFCGSIPWVADLERQLVKEGVYDDFKKAFQNISGKTWEESREDFYFEEDAIVAALAQTTKMSEEAARNWYNKAEENYSLSIEKFAQRVKEYIESKGSNHHVVFMVDEMGQYVGDDTQLMLNLQTVVEQLGIYCGGKCWVIVTSQQEIDSITKVKGNDFSKIQGRFDTRISLSSANVDEVIRKRILQKNETARKTLQLLFPQKRSIINNLITFKDTPEMKTFTNEDDFVDVYPFVPYQFQLLQKVFTGIRIHGAAGKHLAEGERSLLSAFQESAVKYANQEIGFLVPFSAFYETIESFLDANIRSVIIQAKQNTRLTDYDVEVLKLLFLIKYVREMPGNIENIATLMVRHIDDDKIEIKKKVESSLQRLIDQSLVQKNGEEYIFLTNDEQDVNREIKSILIDSTEVIHELGLTIFEDIYAEKKYRYSSHYHFPFNTYIDDQPLRQQGHTFGIRVITPYYDGHTELTEAELKLMSMRENNIIIRLPSDTSVIEEMEEAKKIETYLRKISGSTATDVIEDIRARKRREATDRRKRVKELLIEGLKEGEFYVNNQLLNLKAKNPEERINEAFKVLVDALYNKLHYIKEHIDYKNLSNLVDNSVVQLELGEDPNKLAIDEINAYIKRNSQRNITMTLKSIINHFTNIPYGWLEEDIVACIIKLFKAQEIKLQLNQQYVQITDKDLINYLTKRDYVERLIIKEREKTPQKYIQNVKELARELFKRTALPGDEDGLRQVFNSAIKEELHKVERLLDKYDKKPYPGKNVLERGKEIMKQLLNVQDTSEWYNTAYRLRDDFLDYADNVEDVKHFFDTENTSVSQQQIFDNALEKLEIYEKSKTYLIDEEIHSIVNKMKSIVYQQHPYGQIHLLPDLIDQFVQKFTDLLEMECEPVREVIKSDYQRVVEELQALPFKDQLLTRFKTLFDDLLERIDRVNNFYEAIAMKEESDRVKLRCFKEIEAYIEQEKKNESKVKSVNNDKDSGVAIISGETKTVYKIKKQKNISVSSIIRGVSTIETEEDINRLVEQLRNRLKEELKEDTIIRLI